MLTLFDHAAAEAAKRAAIAQADAHADPAWRAAALAAIRSTCETMPEFTSDDVWRVLSRPREGRALGALMLHAARQRWCEKTGRVTRTSQVSRHGTDVAVWRSLVRGGKA